MSSVSIRLYELRWLLALVVLAIVVLSLVLADSSSAATYGRYYRP